MAKTLSLKDLHKSFIKEGMDALELSGYMRMSKNILQQWEQYFHLFPENSGTGNEYYSDKTIEEFIKIKRQFDKGKSLKDIKTAKFGNPFGKGAVISESNPEKSIKRTQNPFEEELDLANQTINELVFQRSKLIEESAIDKTNLLSQVNILKTRNQELSTEKAKLEELVKEQEEKLVKSLNQEITLKETIKNNKQLLEDKDKEIGSLKGRIKTYEDKILEKTIIIEKQETELNRMIEEKNRKRWWQIWRYVSK